jgi:hypothetical protein
LALAVVESPDVEFGDLRIENEMLRKAKHGLPGRR